MYAHTLAPYTPYIARGVVVVEKNEKIRHVVLYTSSHSDHAQRVATEKTDRSCAGLKKIKLTLVMLPLFTSPSPATLPPIAAFACACGKF